jgi:hypothetical protein
MKKIVYGVAVIAGIMIAVLLLSSFRYEYRTAGRLLYKIDRMTGDVWIIYGTTERKVQREYYEPSAEAPKAAPAEAPAEAPAAPPSAD